MKTFKALVALVLAALFSINAFAGSALGKTIIASQPQADGKVYFYFEEAMGVPTCAFSNLTRFVVDGTAPGGAVQVELLAAAMVNGKTIYAYGTGTCSLVSDSETLDYAIVYP